MNNNMITGIMRHFLTIAAGASLANGTESLDALMPNLLNGITTGDTSTIIGASIAIFTILWSMWTKASEQTKQTVVKTMSFGRK